MSVLWYNPNNYPEAAAHTKPFPKTSAVPMYLPSSVLQVQHLLPSVCIAYIPGGRRHHNQRKRYALILYLFS